MSLDRIFNAESVAIVGASRDETKRGHQAVKILLEEKFTGPVYPVHPHEKHILGLACHPRVSAIPGPVDLALITTPAATIPAILEDCGAKGVAGAVIVAGGFGEMGAEGRERENRLTDLARRHGIRLIGPNTSGLINLHTNLNLVGLRDAPRGDIALLSQSGNMALTLITEARLKSHRGFSYYIGVGNEADMKFHEYLAFFEQDPATRAILIYVEGMREGRRFLQQAYRTTRKKPVILLKSGRSATGKRAAGSHTGALAGMSRVARGAFERAGIVVIENSDELFPAAETLASLPPIRSNRVAILADGGGHATIAADMLTDLGLLLPTLSAKTQAALRRILPAAATVANPVDVAGGTDADPSLFADCARIILNDPAVGGLLVVGLFGGYGLRFAPHLSLKEEDAAHQMGKLVQKKKKPIVVHSLYTSEKPHALDLLRYYDITVYDSLEIACKVVGVLAQYGRYLKSYPAKVDFVMDWRAKARPEAQALIAQARQENRHLLLEHEAKALLGTHGAAVSTDTLARTADEAVTCAARAAGPVALKIVSPDILHKTDAGGVRVGLDDEQSVREAFADIQANARAFAPRADIRGVLVAPMAGPGAELIVGTKYDDQFGPVIMFGLGGVLVEILKDVSFRVLPISLLSARRMIEEIKAYPILSGTRNIPPYDKRAIKRLLMICSEIMAAYPDILEMDLNPVIVYPIGLRVVDARILLKNTEADDPPSQGPA
ncbi:MAG: acetate--CoA ligase family protein [Desulfobacterales bacterium]|nr:acetate--CoA ligase family protein [Desulfobacterales bacterium]